MPKLPDKTALGGLPSLRSGRHYATEGEAKADVSGQEAANIALAKGFSSLAGSVEKIADAEVQQQDAMDLIKANVAHAEGLRDLGNEFDTDPDYQTFRPRYADRATQLTADASAGIRNANLRSRWIEQANGRNVTSMDRVLDRGTRLQKESKEVEVDKALQSYRNLYGTARDDAARQRVLRDMDVAVTAAQRTGLLDLSRGEALRERAINDALKDDAERRMLAGEAVTVMRELGALPRDKSQEAMASGTTSEAGIDFIKRVEGTRDVGWDVRQFSGPYGVRRGKDEKLTLEQAEVRLREEVGKVETWLAKNVKVPLTQQQHDALVSFGYNLGTGAIGKLIGDINAGDHDKVAARMRTFDKAENSEGKLEPLAGLTARRAQESEMYLGSGPTGPYARMSFGARHALITRAKISMSAETQQDLKDAYQEILETGEAKRRPDGTTAIDRARMFLQPNQAAKADLMLEEARLLHGATTPLRSMSEREAVEHLRKFQEGRATGERAGVMRKVQRAAESAWAEIQAERDSDPAEEVDPFKNVKTPRAGKTQRADEVTGAYEVIQRRFPGVAVRPTPVGGIEILDPETNDPAQIADTHKARRALIEARLEAQERLGVSRFKRQPITRREADELLDLPENPNTMTPANYRIALQAAADRAEARYGKEMGPIVLEAALGFRKSGDGEHKEMATRLMARLARGEAITRSDVKRLQDLRDLDRRRSIFYRPWADQGEPPASPARSVTPMTRAERLKQQPSNPFDADDGEP